MNRGFVSLLWVLFLSSTLSAQQQARPAPATAQLNTAKSTTPDFSQEPFVIEKYFLAAKFENDGTGERTLSSRIKVQSDAGVQQLGELIFGYNAASEKMDVHF